MAEWARTHRQHAHRATRRARRAATRRHARTDVARGDGAYPALPRARAGPEGERASSAFHSKPALRERAAGGEESFCLEGPTSTTTSSAIHGCSMVPRGCSDRAPPVRPPAKVPRWPRSTTRSFSLGDSSGAGSQNFGDTWMFDGTNWTLATTSGPSPRWGAAMATLNGSVVLFGGNRYDGSNDEGYAEDTWIFDGAAWTQVSASGPPARDSAAMAAINGKIVLFGGRTPRREPVSVTRGHSTVRRGRKCPRLPPPTSHRRWPRWGTKSCSLAMVIRGRPTELPGQDFELGPARTPVGFDGGAHRQNRPLRRGGLGEQQRRRLRRYMDVRGNVGAGVGLGPARARLGCDGHAPMMTS